jgi:isopentenyl-diphosphate Delta-isomerase
MEPSTSSVKEQHLRICLEMDVQSSLSTGFERYRFVHRALPEINRHDVDTSLTLFGKKLSAPIIISPMTGGTARAAKINRNLASAAQDLGLAMGVGSQRAALRDPSLVYTYEVRDVAPDILLFANLGAIHLKFGYGVDECRRAMQMIGADVMSLYLNPLQEALQPGGNAGFAGVLPRLAEVCRQLDAPVLVKEVGFGLSGEVAGRLHLAGVAAIDVAGAGGTSWAKVERFVAAPELDRVDSVPFDGWGLPTAEAVVEAGQVVPQRPIIASGGIRTGVDVAKAIALGATATGLALPLLEPATRSVEAVRATLSNLMEDLRTAMFCVGAGSLAELRAIQLATA